MKRILCTIFLVSVLALAGCDKEWFGKSIEGRYAGTFTRTGTGNTPTANVTLEFSNGKFSGASDMTTYPAICNGEYSTSGKWLNITNQCVFTANFDWTLIFNNEYQYELNGDNLRITRVYNTGQMDVYMLTRE
jgi:hypothetical protein